MGEPLPRPWRVSIQRAGRRRSRIEWEWPRQCTPDGCQACRCPERGLVCGLSPHHPVMSALFTHLHVHSEYSLTDSTIRVAELVAACVGAGMPAVALTDQSNLFALVKFYKAAESAGIKPIAGCDLWIGDPENRAPPQRVTVLCQNREGYLNLSRLLSRAYAEGRHGEHALVDSGWLDAANAGLIALAGRESDIGRLLIGGRDDAAHARADWWRTRFPEPRIPASDYEVVQAQFQLPRARPPLPRSPGSAIRTANRVQLLRLPEKR